MTVWQLAKPHAFADDNVRLSRRVCGARTALRDGREETNGVLTVLAAKHADGDPAAGMRHATPSGAVRGRPLCIPWAHPFSHQTDHRRQTTTLRRLAGIDFGITDFLVFATDPASQRFNPSEEPS